MSEQSESASARVYRIGEAVYRLEPLSWQQNKWLADHVFRSIDVHRLDYAVVHDLLRQHGPLFMAICLLREGQTRQEHSKLPFATIAARAEEFAGELTGGEVALFGPHFFQSCRPDQLAMLIPGATLQRLVGEAARQSLAPGETGSSAASSPSAAETSPSSGSSSATGDPLIQIRTSGDASNGMPSIAPSSAGAACSSPG
jgi:hypothetical protein